MGTLKKKKCKHCRMLFIPDPRNRDRQGYCDLPDCRKASKKASQHKWLRKPENRDHFRGHVNVLRVQEWRRKHPGYWKKSKVALQDSLNLQHVVNTDNTGQIPADALQDSLNAQHAVLIGLIANITGVALQDDIARTLLRLKQLGQDILNPLTHFKGGLYDNKTPHLNKPHPKDSLSVQLDRSQSCARPPY